MTKSISLILILLCTVIPNKVFSCSCIGEISVRRAVKYSDLVITGQVLSKEIIESRDTLNFGPKRNQYLRVFTKYEALYKVLVLNKYKGKIKSDTVTIITGISGGDCGFNFEVGMKYIIYGSDEKSMGNGEAGKLPINTFSTNICTRTVSYNDREAEQIKRFTRRSLFAG